MINEHLFNPLMGIRFEEPSDEGADQPDETTDEGKTTGSDIESLDEALDALSNARDDAKKQRLKRKEFESKVNELSGIKEKFDQFKSIFGEDEEVDPEKLKNERDTLQSQLQKERVKNSITVNAINEGLDPDLTIALLESKGKLSDLDPSDSESIKQVVSKVAEDKPNLKNGKAVTTGDSNKDKSESKTNLNEWIHQQAGR